MGMTLKRWKLVIIVGGVVGLSMVPILDVLVYWLVYYTPTYYAHSPELLTDTLVTLAQVGLIMKYWLVAVGLVALIGWFRDLSERDRAI